MAKLNDTQLIFLSVAAARADGAATFPADMPSAVARRVGAKLVRLGLMGEVEAKTGMPVWREDGDIRFSLVMTDAGREAIGVQEDSDQTENVARVGPKFVGIKMSSAKNSSSPQFESAQNSTTTTSSRRENTKQFGSAESLKENATLSERRAISPSSPGAKQALLIKLLSRKSGACMSEMTSATGWLPHSTRAALTGLRKKGMQVERFRKADGSSVYRLIAAPTAAA